MIRVRNVYTQTSQAGDNPHAVCYNLYAHIDKKLLQVRACPVRTVQQKQAHSEQDAREDLRNRPTVYAGMDTALAHLA